MLDKHGREITYIRVSVTPNCNLRCSYCFPSDGAASQNRRDALSLDEITRLIRIFSGAGIKKVRLTGGEPLLRDGIASLVRGVKKIEGIDEVALSTNGVLLGEMVRELKLAGLDKINVSLDSLRPERIREISGLDVFGKIIGAVKRIAEENIWPLKINVVLIKGFNDDEILDFAGLAALYPVEVRFIEMMPTAGNRLWSGREPMNGAETKAKVEEKYRLSPFLNPNGIGGPAKVYELADGKGRVGFISPLSDRFCGDCNRLRLTAEGTLRHCLFSDMEVDLRPGFSENRADGWFLEKFMDALSQKPSGHGLSMESPPPCSRPMAAIGG